MDNWRNPRENPPPLKKWVAISVYIDALKKMEVKADFMVGENQWHTYEAICIKAWTDLPEYDGEVGLNLPPEEDEKDD